MPNVRIRQSDIDNLARKLDEISNVLTAEERALFMAVFKLAGSALSGAAASGGAETESGRLGSVGLSGPAMPSLSTGFRDAFRPIVGPGGIGPGGGPNPAGLDVDVHVGW